jgi:hypothetical protein
MTREDRNGQRATFAAKARGMSEAALRYSLKDVEETLKLHPELCPFSDVWCSRLWAEKEAYSAELARRTRWAA